MARPVRPTVPYASPVHASPCFDESPDRARPRTSRVGIRRRGPGASSTGGSASIRIVLAVAALLFMVGRLVDVQIIHSGAYQAEAQRNEVAPRRSRSTSLRGGIYAPRRVAARAFRADRRRDRRCNFQVTHPMKTALGAFAASARAGGDAGRSLSFTGIRASVVLAKQLSPAATGQKIAADAIPGITLVDDSKRVVPNGNLASPVLGFTNAATIKERPESSTPTTVSWPAPPARRR